MISKDGRDLPINEITKENYQPKEKDMKVFHIKIEHETFNKGKKVSKPYVQMFGVRAWASAKEQLKAQEDTKIEIIYDPTTYNMKKISDGKISKNDKGLTKSERAQMEAMSIEIEALRAEKIRMESDLAKAKVVIKGNNI